LKHRFMGKKGRTILGGGFSLSYALCVTKSRQYLVLLQFEFSKSGTKDHLQQERPKTVASNTVDASNDCKDPKNGLRPDWESIDGS